MSVDLGSVHGSLGFDYDGSGVAAALADLGRLQSQSIGIDSAMRTAGTALLGAGAAGAAGIGIAIGAAADFDKQLSGIAAVGGADARQQMDAIRQTALQLGADTQYSAGQAASAMEDLIKAGVSVDDTVNGVTQSTLALAAATGTDVTRSAEIMSQAYNVFGSTMDANLTPLQKTGDIANLLSQAANAAATDVTDLGQGLGNVGPVAAGAGLGIDETVKALALLSNAGIAGAEGGTMLKSMLLTLYTPTAKQKEAFAALGTSADAFRDTIRDTGIAEAMAELKGRMDDAGYSADQTGEALSTIFGSYGVTAAQTFFKEGTAGWDALTQGMATAGDVSDSARTRMDNLSGDLEQLSGSFDTLKIAVGENFMPLLRPFVQGLTDLVNGFLALPAPIQGAVAMLGAAGSAIALLGGGALLIAPKVLDGVQAFQTLGSAMKGLQAGSSLLSVALSPVGIAVLAIGAAIVAYQTNFLGFRDFVNGVGSAITSVLGPALETLRTKFDALRAMFQAFTDSGMSPLQAGLAALTAVFPALAGPIQTAESLFAKLQGVLSSLSEYLKVVWTDGDLLNDWLSHLPGPLQPVAMLIGNTVDTLHRFAEAVGAAASALASGDLTGVLTNLASAFGTLIVGILGNDQIIGTAVLNLIAAIGSAIASTDWGAVGTAITTGLQHAFAAIGNLVGPLTQNLLAMFQGIDWGVVLASLGSVAGQIGAAFGDLAPVGADIVGRIASGLGAAAGQLVSAVGTLGGQALAAFNAWLGQVGPGIAAQSANWLVPVTTFGTNLVAAVGAFAATALTAVQGWATNVGLAFSRFAAAALTTVQGWATNVGTTIATFATTTLTAVQGWVTTVGTAMAAVTATALTTVQGWATSVGAAIATFATTALTTVQTWATNVGAAISTLTTTALTAIQTWGTDALAAITGLTTAALTAIQTWGTDTLTAVTTFTTTALTTVQAWGTDALAAVTTFGTDALAAITTFGANAVSAAQTKFDELKAAVSAKLDEAKAAVQGMADAIPGILSSIDLTQIGKDLVQGFINGIGSMLGGVTDAVGSIGGAALDGLKGKLGISSPSREAARIGDWFGQGFAHGIDGSLRLAVAGADRMGGAALDALRQQPPTVRGALAARDQWAQGLQRQAIAVESTVVIDDREMGRYVVGKALGPMREAANRTGRRHGGVRV